MASHWKKIETATHQRVFSLHKGSPSNAVLQLLLLILFTNSLVRDT